MELHGVFANAFQKSAAPIGLQSEKLEHSIEGAELAVDKEELRDTAITLLINMAAFIKNPTETFDLTTHNQFAANIHKALSDANQSHLPTKRFSWLENSFRDLLDQTFKLYQQFNQKLFTYDYKHGSRLLQNDKNLNQGIIYSVKSADYLNDAERRLIYSVTSNYLHQSLPLLQGAGEHTGAAFHFQNIPGQGLSLVKEHKPVDTSMLFKEQVENHDSSLILDAIKELITQAQDEIESRNPKLLEKSWICSFEFLEPFSPN